ncbi:MAG: RES domain-containing protein [Arenicella sp.]|jgi:RES domain-containing protein
MAGWRIAKLKYAQSIDDMMSGEGAYLFGGRWNLRGTRMVCLGSSIAQGLGEHLKRQYALGILYNSIRYPGGQCIDALRPSALTPSISYSRSHIETNR